MFGICRVCGASLSSCPSTKILIENSETLECLTQPGKWTKNLLDGKHFPVTEAAFETAKHEAIGKFNTVCHIPQTNQFINLDHGKGRGPSAAPAR